MQTYRIIATVSMEHIGDVLKVLTPMVTEAPDVEKVPGGEIKPGRSARTARKTTATPTSETRSGKLLLGAMKEQRAYTKDELGKVLTAAGLSENSVSPTMSGLIKEGAVTKLGRGQFRPNEARAAGSLL